MWHIHRKTVSILTIPNVFQDSSPPCQNKSEIGKPPLPPLSEKIRNWLTPPLPPCQKKFINWLTPPLPLVADIICEPPLMASN